MTVLSFLLFSIFEISKQRLFASSSGNTVSPWIYEFGGEPLVRGTAIGISSSQCIRVNVLSMTPCRSPKELLFHKGSHFANLSVTKPRPCPGNFTGAKLLISVKLRNCPGHGFSIFNLQQTVHRIFKQLSSSCPEYDKISEKKKREMLIYHSGTHTKTSKRSRVIESMGGQTFNPR